MIYLSGCVQKRWEHPRLGWMLTPDMGNVIPTHGVWALDNACFNNPEAFSLDRFLAFAERKLEEAGDRCLFVVAPDVPRSPERTLARWREWAPRLRELGHPLALVVQDGMGSEDIPWGEVDALFVGGGNKRWMYGHEAGALVHEARAKGKWTHMGMVNSLRLIRAAASMGVDSADGTFLKFAPDQNWQRFQKWMKAFNREPIMLL